MPAVESPALAATPAVAASASAPASAAPAHSPTNAPDASLTAAPSATPSPSPTPPLSDKQDPAPKGDPSEIVAARTETSRTFDNHDGTYSTDLYTDPVYYKPAGAATYVPIEVGFAAPTAAGDAVAVSDKAPTAVAVAPADAPGGFLRISGADHKISFGLPDAAKTAATKVDPTTDGSVADYPDFLPGVDLRIFARAYGAKSFFIWHAVPADSSITVTVDAPGLTLRLEGDGSISATDVEGKTIGRMPRPFAVDSSVDAARGGGIFTDKVAYVLAKDGTTLTIAVDPAWLKSATYPVFVDPTFNVDNAGSNTYGDAHTASAFATTNFADYQRPDSPFYHELWLGDDPSGTSGTSAAYLRWDVSSLNYTAISEATLHIYPYHQFSSPPTSSLANLKRVTTSWTESGLTWNTKPGSDPNIVASANCVEATTCDLNVQALVQSWADGTYANYGMKLEEPSGQSYWKRLIASEQGGIHTENLHVTYHTISAASTTAAFGSTISWAFTDALGDPQARYQAQIATNSAYTTILADSGLVTSAVSAYLPAPATPLTDDTVYYYRFRVGDTQGLTGWVTGSWRNDAYRRGDETYYASTPFDLNGGPGLDIGAHNGEARLSRSLFSIPSYGPPGELSLAYSSLDGSSAGRFGVGWSSNLTQYLTFPAGLVEWHRPDAGRVAFSGSGSTWTVAGGHFETLAYDGVAHTYTITAKDQTKLVFQDASPGRLLKIQNRFGKALTLVWNTSSATATDASSRVTSIVIDSANNRITGVTDSAGRAWGFAYTGTDLTTLTDPASKTTTFGYDASHHLTTITRTRSKAAGGTDTITWTFGYTGGKATSVLDPIGAATTGSPAHTFTYNAGSTVAGLLKTYPSPVTRNTTTTTLDPYGRPTSILDPGGYTTNQTLDSKGNLLATDRPIDLSPATWATTTFTYDTAGNVLTETVPEANATDLVTSVMTYNATNDLLTRSESDNFAGEKVITLNTYDAAGHLASTVENCTTSGTTPPTPASSCTAAGTHDGSTNLTTTYVYTANDQADVEWDPRGFATKHLYDANGNETFTISDCTTTGTTVPTRGGSCTAAGTHDASTNVATSATFDLANRDGKAGLPGTETDPTGAVTTDAYDALGRQTSEVLPGDATIPVRTRTTAYDELGETLTETDAWPGLSPSRVTNDVYDLRGRRTSETDPSSVTATSAYDAAGNETSSTSGGSPTTRIFDSLGNATSETVGTGGDIVTTAHTFNGQGVETLTAPSGTTTTRAPDLVARVTLLTVDPSGLNLATTYDYGTHTGIITATQPGGLAIASTTDRTGRTTQTVTSQGSSSLTETTAFDADGNKITVSAPHASGTGTVMTTTSDPLNRATVVVSNDVASPSGPDQDVTSTSFYDAAGRVIATKDPTGIVARTFYNPRGLAWKTISNCTDTGTSPPADPATCAGTGTADASTNVVITNTYDGSGVVLATTTAASSGTEVTAYTYNSAGQTTKVIVDQAGLNLTTETYYDANGNEVAVKDPRGTVTRTILDTARRVSKTILNCTDSGTTPPVNPATCAGTGTSDATWNLTTSYTYDARGNKASETAPNGRATTFAYDAADQLVSQTENWVASPTQADQNLTTYFYYDAAGNQAAVKAPTIDRTTFAVTRHVYDAFGRLTNEVRNCTDSGTTPPVSPATCAGTGTRDAATNLETITAYDDHGNKTAVTAPDPSATTGTSTATVKTEYAYDGVDRLCRVLENAQSGVVLQSLADPCGTALTGTATTNVSTRYTHDIEGNLATMVDGVGHITTYAYDKAGQMTSLIDANGKTLSWGHDVRGNRTSQTNRTAGQSVTWTYDHADRMATRLADGVTVTYGYDSNGNRTGAGDGTRTISTTYDLLSRPLAVTTSDDAGAATNTTYSLTSPTWSDPTGTYAAVLDEFGRQTSVTDPIHPGSPFTTSYRADGQPGSATAPNGNRTTSAYDNAGNPTSMTTAGIGPVNRAVYTWTLNRAGNRLSENSQVTGDPTNGTTTYGYDQLDRLTGYTPPAAIPNQAYSWQAVPNRATQQLGAGPIVTTNYDNANRPLTDTAGGTYSSDFDGRLTAMPGQTMTYDSLGRLTGVTISGVTSSYTYDPLDRLRTVTRAGAVQRFRYVGATAQAAQILDGSGTVLRSIANDWTGGRLVDWTGSGANQRFYGTNGHGDVTWVGDNAGLVTATLRYDPWGVGQASTGTPPDFRFQGSWFDVATNLSWVINRWYAPGIGRFLTEDSLLGAIGEPASRHLYAYGQSQPISRNDTDGRYWHLVRPWETLAFIASTRLGAIRRWPAIWNANRPSLPMSPSATAELATWSCIWIPVGWFTRASYQVLYHQANEICPSHPRVSYSATLRGFSRDSLKTAQDVTGVGDDRLLFNFTRRQLYDKTDQTTDHRPRSPTLSDWTGIFRRVEPENAAARTYITTSNVYEEPWLPGVYVVQGRNHPWYCFDHPCTRGEYVFLNGFSPWDPYYKTLLSHEYIHVLQFEGRGHKFYTAYERWLLNPWHLFDSSAHHPEEAPAYLWEAWIQNFHRYGEAYPWTIWRR